ncbi:MAG: UDP-N-acetylmuramoyl-tripeptide--D-alanyl-D-alanine ligase [Brevinema sp.]
MIGDVKVLFDHHFFKKALRVKPKNEQEFLIRYFTIDSRIEGDTALYCFIGIKGKNFDGNDFFEDAYNRGFRVFVLQKSPEKIPHDAIIYLVDDTIIALSDLAKEHKHNLIISSILITGSIGKTTTRRMLTHVFKQKYPVHTAKKNWNNHIGLPLTILETPPDAKMSILEAGMSAPGEIEYLSKIVEPNIAIITNVGYSHAEFIGGIDQIAQCKAEITEGMNKGSILLINTHDPYKNLFISKAKGSIQFFDPNDLQIINDECLDGFTFTHKQYPDEVFRCPIPGKHLLLNLAIVFACVEIFHIPVECIHEGLKHIQEDLGNRMHVFKKNSITVIDDCYNASLESFNATLDVLSNAQNLGRKIAIIGDILELGDQAEWVHREIGKKISLLKNIDLVLAVGHNMNYTCSELKNIPYAHFMNNEDILEILKRELAPNDIVLVKGSNGMKLNMLVTYLENTVIF